MPPLEDSLLIAFCKNPCPSLGELGGVDAGDSGAFFSFAEGGTAAPNELKCSEGGLFDDFASVCVSAAFGGVVFELDENLELMLETHELFRPGATGFGSFWLLADIVAGTSTFSETERWRLCDWEGEAPFTSGKGDGRLLWAGSKVVLSPGWPSAPGTDDFCA